MEQEIMEEWCKENQHNSLLYKLLNPKINPHCTYCWIVCLHITLEKNVLFDS